MARMSAKDVADRLGVNYVVASGLVTLLNERGQAPLLDKVFHPSGRGKPTRFYDIPESVTLSLADAPAASVEPAAASSESEDVSVLSDVDGVPAACDSVTVVASTVETDTPIAEQFETDAADDFVAEQFETDSDNFESEFDDCDDDADDEGSFCDDDDCDDVEIVDESEDGDDDDWSDAA